MRSRWIISWHSFAPQKHRGMNKQVEKNHLEACWICKVRRSMRPEADRTRQKSRNWLDRTWKYLEDQRERQETGQSIRVEGWAKSNTASLTHKQWKLEKVTRRQRVSLDENKCALICIVQRTCINDYSWYIVDYCGVSTSITMEESWSASMGAFQESPTPARCFTSDAALLLTPDTKTPQRC